MDVREYIGAREYGEIIGKHYRTVIRNYKEGLIDGYTNEAGRVYIRNPNYNNIDDNIAAIRYENLSEIENTTYKVDRMLENKYIYKADKTKTYWS